MKTTTQWQKSTVQVPHKKTDFMKLAKKKDQKELQKEFKKEMIMN